MNDFRSRNKIRKIFFFWGGGGLDWISGHFDYDYDMERVMATHM